VLLFLALVLLPALLRMSSLRHLLSAMVCAKLDGGVQATRQCHKAPHHSLATPDSLRLYGPWAALLNGRHTDIPDYGILNALVYLLL